MKPKNSFIRDIEYKIYTKWVSWSLYWFPAVLLLPQIGNKLLFSQECVELVDKIYPTYAHIMTPYTSAQIRRKLGPKRRIKCLKLNIIFKYCVCLEHAIAEIIRYRPISSVWINKQLYNIICTYLTCNKKVIALTVFNWMINILR